MSQLTIELPDTLARVLEEAARAEQKSTAQVVLERLSASFLVPGSREAVLAALERGPEVDPDLVDQMMREIKAGRRSSDKNLFED
jgi:predicted transcriptional regulator